MNQMPELNRDHVYVQFQQRCDELLADLQSESESTANLNPLIAWRLEQLRKDHAAMCRVLDFADERRKASK